MAQYDVRRIGDQLVVVCQSELLDDYPTRFVIPLGASDLARQGPQRFNPSFNVNGERMTLLPQYASSVRLRDLGPVVFSLAHHSYEITDAIDVLLSGV